MKKRFLVILLSMILITGNGCAAHSSVLKDSHRYYKIDRTYDDAEALFYYTTASANGHFCLFPNGDLLNNIANAAFRYLDEAQTLPASQSPIYDHLQIHIRMAAKYTMNIPEGFVYALPEMVSDITGKDGDTSVIVTDFTLTSPHKADEVFESSLLIIVGPEGIYTCLGTGYEEDEHCFVSYQKQDYYKQLYYFTSYAVLGSQRENYRKGECGLSFSFILLHPSKQEPAENITLYCTQVCYNEDGQWTGIYQTDCGPRSSPSFYVGPVKYRDQTGQANDTTAEIS